MYGTVEKLSEDMSVATAPDASSRLRSAMEAGAVRITNALSMALLETLAGAVRDVEEGVHYSPGPLTTG